MKLLIASSFEQAAEFNERAFAYLRQAARAQGSGWSDIFVDYGTPPRWAILFAGDISGAFTEEELGEIDGDGNRANVIDGERIIRNEQGQFVSGNWEAHSPAEPEPE